MEISNITLTAIFTTFLITRTVESTGWGSGRPFKLPGLPPEPSSGATGSDTRTLKEKLAAFEKLSKGQESPAIPPQPKKPIGTTGGVKAPFALKPPGPRVSGPPKPPAKPLPTKQPPKSGIATPQPPVPKLKPIPKPSPQPSSGTTGASGGGIKSRMGELRGEFGQSIGLESGRPQMAKPSKPPAKPLLIDPPPKPVIAPYQPSVPKLRPIPKPPSVSKSSPPPSSGAAGPSGGGVKSRMEELRGKFEQPTGLESEKPQMPKPSKLPSKVAESLPVPVPVKVEDTITSSPEGRRFMEAIQNGDTIVMKKIFDDGSDELKKLCGEYLVSLKGSRLIELIKKTVERQWILQTLLVHADQSLIDEVFGKIKLDLSMLRLVAWSADVVCVPQRFTYILKKMKSESEQKLAVTVGVRAVLNANRGKCLDLLFSALDEGIFKDTGLVNVAVHEAFVHASAFTDDRADFAKDFFDHPAVTAEDYSNALISLYNKGGLTNELFSWLLERADRRDLEAVSSEYKDREWEPEFRLAVISRWMDVFEKTREEIGREEREARDALINETLTDFLIDDVIGIVEDYTKRQH